MCLVKSWSLIRLSLVSDPIAHALSGCGYVNEAGDATKLICGVDSKETASVRGVALGPDSVLTSLSATSAEFVYLRSAGEVSGLRATCADEREAVGLCLVSDRGK